jgi:tape measure domain-containing protein
MANNTANVNITANASQMLATMQKIQQSVNQLNQTMSNVGSSSTKGLNNINTSVNNLNKSFKSFNSTLSTFGHLLITAAATNIVKDLVNNITQFDRWNRSLEATSEGLQSVSYATGFLRKESERLGLVFLDQMKGYTQLSATAKMAGMSLEEINNIYLSVAEASSVFQLSQEDSYQSLRALMQMVSKGTISAEELRGQLGERIPGALSIMAKSLGVSTQKLLDMMDQGQLLARDVLPKFAKTLREEVSNGLDLSTQSIQANINRMTTAWQDFKKEILNSKEINDAIKKITEALKDPKIIDNVKNIFNGITKAASTVIDWMIKYPEMFEFGIIGYLLFGKRGAIILAAVGNILPKIALQAKAAEAQIQGIISSEEYWKSSQEGKLEDLLNKREKERNLYYDKDNNKFIPYTNISNPKADVQPGKGTPGGSGSELKKSIIDQIARIMDEVEARRLQVLGQTEAAEIASIEKQYNVWLRNENLKAEQRAKIEDTLQLQIQQIRAKYAVERTARQSEFDEYYKGGAPSEARMLQNKTYQMNQDYIDSDQVIINEKAIDSLKEYQSELKSIIAENTGDREMALEAELEYIEQWKKAKYEEIDALNAENEITLKLKESVDQLAEAKGKSAQIKQNELQTWANTAKTGMEQLQTVAISAAESFSTGFTDAFMSFVDGTKSAKDAFKEFAATFLKEIAKMIMQQMILNAIKSATSYGFAMADGGILPGGIAFADGGIAPGGFKAFSTGGIVNQPTVGIVGEGKFNEAIVPLPDGRSIPVVMKGGNQNQNNFNIAVNVDGSKGGTREQNDKMAKQIAREIKDQVKMILVDERRYGGTLGRNSQRAY